VVSSRCVPCQGADQGKPHGTSRASTIGLRPDGCGPAELFEESLRQHPPVLQLTGGENPVVPRLVPLAADGLRRAGVDEEEVDRLLAS
jgi:hypothetical protein